VDAADRLMRPHHMEAVPFQRQLARMEHLAGSDTADLYYDTDINALRPRVCVAPRLRVCRLQTHPAPIPSVVPVDSD
jgi:hypothetical protein